MRICDRHEAKKVKATDFLHLSSTDEHFDLCADCVDEIMAFIQKPAKRAKKKEKDPETS